MIKKGDFIELDYTAKLKDDKLVFDTTLEDVAKASGNFNKKFKYSPVIICVGEHHLIPGLDSSLEGKEAGSHTIEILAENGFGKKRADLLKLIPLRLFQKDEVQPYPGLEVNIDGQLGLVKSVSGGRVIVDFNHPLSGKDLVYDIDIKRVVSDPIEQVRAVLELIHLPHTGIDILDGKATVFIKEKIPDEIITGIAEDLKRMTGLKELVFALDKKEAKEPMKDHSKPKEGGKKE
ncbi:peptidylprolyl isomerase [Candidatus Woesearchaeota archaeon]|nr:peptidylprolyl isomerase [Candidatus Woesearchaeota archaeon]